MRSISVADAIVERVPRDLVVDSVRRAKRGRADCYVCEERIAIDGEASLVILEGDRAFRVVVAHSFCAPSELVDAEGVGRMALLDLGRAFHLAEGMLFMFANSIDRWVVPGIVVDQIGSAGPASFEGRQATDIYQTITSNSGVDMELLFYRDSLDLRALDGSMLFQADNAMEMPPMWYQLASSLGSVMVMMGTDTGIRTKHWTRWDFDDLVQGLDLTIGIAKFVPLDKKRQRNGLCVCRSGRKFKTCHWVHRDRYSGVKSEVDPVFGPSEIRTDTGEN